MQVGSVYQTNRCGNVEIISINKSKALVSFINTGTVKEFRTCWIESGCIRDPYAKLFCGVACVGNISTKGKYRPYYSVWHDMIDRCYNENNKRYTAYKNVFVCERWLVFENFYNDCKSIEGFDEVEFLNGNLVLDKDIKQRFAKEKIYSPATCTWTDKTTNASIQDNQQKNFTALSPDGELISSFNITDFARRYNLNRKNISAVLHGHGKTVHGWQFSYEEIA